MKQEIQLTEAQKRDIENEAGFIMYLAKTKQGKFIGNEFFVGKSEPYTKLTELDSDIRKIYFEEYEDQQLLILEFLLYSELTRKVIVQMKDNYYTNLTPVRTALEVVKKKLSPIVNKDFHTVYKNGRKAENGNESDNLLKYLESWAQDVASFRVPSKVVMSKMSKAFNYDNDTMLATADRLIKKFEKNQ